MNSPAEVFWGLGENWWMQIYDGKYHQYGPMVFDEGLHQGQKEPGFYSSIQKACHFAVEHLNSPPNVEFYKQLHRIACSHFDGKSTLITEASTGEFLVGVICKVDAVNLFYHLSKNERDAIEDTLQMAQYEHSYSIKSEAGQKKMRERYGLSKEEFEAAITDSKTKFQEIDKKVEELRSYIDQRSCEIGASKPIVRITQPNPDRVYLYYECRPEEAENVVKKLFENYVDAIGKATSSDEKIRAIADLFQMLEWLHPFRDGQGRTDLVLLAKLLSENGLTPAILEQPYVSTINSLDVWIDYLKKGMEKWEKLLH